MFPFTQTTLFWINYLSYGHLYKQLYDMIRSYCVGWGYCDRVLVCFLYTDYTILDKLFKLRPFILNT